MNKIKNGLIGCLIIGIIYILISIVPKFLNFMETQKDIFHILPEGQVFIIKENNINPNKEINTSQNIPLPSDIAKKMQEEHEYKLRKEAEIAEKERIRQEQIKQEQIQNQEVARKSQQNNTVEVTSRSSSSRTNDIGYVAFVATGYCPCAKCCGKTNGITASGVKAKAGVTVAMPNKYKFGTKIKIKGMGTYIVQDRGGAIKGNKIDIFFNTHQEALNFGRRTVYIKIL